MNGLHIGSLFSGYGGLDMAVEAVTGARTVWVSDIDKGACKILAHHWPDVPNLGDIAAVDWSTVEPVDVLTGGFPCQDVSHAGKRAGLRPDTRTGLWSQMAYAIDQLRPSLIVAENVRGLLSAEAHSDVEPCPLCVGDDTDGALRALGAVLGDLADLGYDARWTGLRAADVGAPHGRFRVFIVAWPAADADSRSLPWVGAAGLGLRIPSERGPLTLPTSYSASDGRDQGRPESAGLVGRPDAALSGDAPTPDACCERHGGREDGAGVGRVDGSAEGEAQQRERSRGVAGDRSATPTADAEGHEQREPFIGLGQRAEPRRSGDGVVWGAYEPAIRRWEAVSGRVAPAPTEPGAKGGQRLSPRFVEWMMGLPDGHVTEVPGLSRNDQLKALGNGVVPMQAAAALSWLLDVAERVA